MKKRIGSIGILAFLALLVWVINHQPSLQPPARDELLKLVSNESIVARQGKLPGPNRFLGEHLGTEWYVAIDDDDRGNLYLYYENGKAELVKTETEISSTGYILRIFTRNSSFQVESPGEKPKRILTFPLKPPIMKQFHDLFQ